MGLARAVRARKRIARCCESSHFKVWMYIQMLMMMLKTGGLFEDC